MATVVGPLLGILVAPRREGRRRSSKAAPCQTLGSPFHPGPAAASHRRPDAHPAPETTPTPGKASATSPPACRARPWVLAPPLPAHPSSPRPPPSVLAPPGAACPVLLRVSHRLLDLFAGVLDGRAGARCEVRRMTRRPGEPILSGRVGRWRGCPQIVNWFAAVTAARPQPDRFVCRLLGRRCACAAHHGARRTCRGARGGGAHIYRAAAVPQWPPQTSLQPATEKQTTSLERQTVGRRSRTRERPLREFHGVRRPACRPLARVGMTKAASTSSAPMATERWRPRRQATATIEGPVLAAAHCR